MRRLLLTAVSLAATTSALAGIPAGVTVDSGKLAGRTGTSPEIRVFKGIQQQAGPLPATLAFFDDGYQQLLKGGANQ